MTPARKRDWITAGYIIGTVALIWLFERERAAKAASGDLPIGIQPGLMTGVKTPSLGVAVLELPGGGHWIKAVDTAGGVTTPKTLPLPGDVSSPLSVAVGPGTTVALQWSDATGTLETTFIGFV